MIETRMTEERIVTAEPREMLNKYLTRRLSRSWTEGFVDDDTGEVVSIERNEVLFDRGKLIDRDMLAEIQFYQEAGDIREVEVSNQRRLAYEEKDTYLHLHLVSVHFVSKNKKFLLFAPNLEACMTALRDYIELNFSGPFYFTSIKVLTVGFVLVDRFRDDGNKDFKDDKDSKDGKKFYQIDFNIDVDGQRNGTDTAIVHTYSVDRAMMLITDELLKRERESVEKLRKAGLKYDNKEITASVEAAKTVSVDYFVEREFSEVYMSEP